jgi:hypothetical protein
MRKEDLGHMLKQRFSLFGDDFSWEECKIYFEVIKNYIVFVNSNSARADNLKLKLSHMRDYLTDFSKMIN